MADKTTLVEIGTGGSATTTAGTTAANQVKILFDDEMPMATTVSLIDQAKAGVIEYYTRR